MGRPKGAKLNPVTGKYEPPEGFVPKPKGGTPVLENPTQQAENAVKRYAKERAEAATNYCFRVYKVNSGGVKYWLADTMEPSLDYIANTFGGGKYEVWKFFTDSGDYLGKPVPYNIDPTIWPPKIPDPQVAAPGMIGGRGGMFGGQQPGPWGSPPGYPQGPGGYPGQYGFPPPGKDDDLEDELDDLEKENAQLKAQLIGLTRERDEAKLAIERERAEWQRKEDRAQFENTLKALEAKFSGSKDPLEQMVMFSKAQAELSGGVVGKGGGMTEMLTLAMGLMNTIMAAAKSLPAEGGSASGLETMMKMADRYLPMITKLTEQKPGGPAPQVVDEKPKTDTPAPAPAAAPAEPAPAPGPEAKAFAEILEVLPNYQAAGDVEKFADWIVSQGGEGWPGAHEIIMAENPAGFLNLVAASIPAAVATDEKKKWVVDVITKAQKKLLDKKASVPKK